MNTIQNTHYLASERLIGEIIKIENKYSEVNLKTTEEMSVDNYGLIHGGFIFGLADYAAMIAVNKPTVVLAKADVRFVNPVKIGDDLIAIAKVINDLDNKNIVNVEITNSNNKKIFDGDFHCYILKKHALA